MSKINLAALNLFVTSLCNSRCENCFYKSSLNKRDDLSLSQIENLSKSLGKVNVLNVSGGEPFLRKEIAEIYNLFIKNNNLKSLSIPTNGLLPDKIAWQTRKIMEISGGRKVVICLSLDGTEKVHDAVRGISGNFKKVSKTYKLLYLLKKEYPNLSIRVGTTVYRENYHDLFKLFIQIPNRFPKIDAVTLSIGRGASFGQKLLIPSPKDLKKLFIHKQKSIDSPFWRKLVERMVFVASLERLEKNRQTVPCLAGQKEAVIYANGSVGLCEMLPSLGNIREKSFKDIWESKEARKLGAKIKKGECFCTHEGFLFHSIRENLFCWPILAFKSIILR